MMQPRPDAVVSELFSSVCAEIRDEVGFSGKVLHVLLIPAKGKCFRFRENVNEAKVNKTDEKFFFIDQIFAEM